MGIEFHTDTLAGRLFTPFGPDSLLGPNWLVPSGDAFVHLQIFYGSFLDCKATFVCHRVESSELSYRKHASVHSLNVWQHFCSSDVHRVSVTQVMNRHVERLRDVGLLHRHFVSLSVDRF